MPVRGNVFAAGQYYHVYNRGVDHGLIFFNSANYEYLLRLVKEHLTDERMTVIACCLMPNHYHFLLRQDSGTLLSHFMSVLFNAYAQGVNRQQQRSGPLFEGRFHHAHVDRDEYLVHLCRYIHLNPVTAKLVPRPENWKYSNYLEWIGQRAGTLLDRQFVTERFPEPERYREFVADWHDEQIHREKVSPYVWD